VPIDSAPVDPEPADNPIEAEAERRLRLGLPEGYYRAALAPSLAHVQAATALPGAPPWRALGPRNIGGRIRDLVQAPLTPATLYAGSASGGVWRTPYGRWSRSASSCTTS